MFRWRIAVSALLAGLLVAPARAESTLYLSYSGTINKITPDGVVTPFVTRINFPLNVAFGPTGAVPEPSSLVLLLLGVAVTAIKVRCRQCA